MSYSHFPSKDFGMMKIEWIYPLNIKINIFFFFFVKFSLCDFTLSIKFSRLKSEWVDKVVEIIVKLLNKAIKYQTYKKEFSATDIIFIHNEMIRSDFIFDDWFIFSHPLHTSLFVTCVQRVKIFILFPFHKF